MFRGEQKKWSELPEQTEINEPLVDRESERRKDFIAVLHSLEANPAPYIVEAIFDTLRAWQTEYGQPKDLLDIACHTLSLDRTAGHIYLRCPDLIPLMERLRNGEPIRKLKITMSEEGRRWWYGLLIVDVLRKCRGLVSHARLVRWLGHRADAGQIRGALELLCEAGLVETYHIKSNDPYRPITWHRLTAVAGESATASNVG